MPTYYWGKFYVIIGAHTYMMGYIMLDLILWEIIRAVHTNYQVHQTHAVIRWGSFIMTNQGGITLKKGLAQRECLTPQIRASDLQIEYENILSFMLSVYDKFAAGKWLKHSDTERSKLFLGMTIFPPPPPHLIAACFGNAPTAIGGWQLNKRVIWRRLNRTYSCLAAFLPHCYQMDHCRLRLLRWVS